MFSSIIPQGLEWNVAFGLASVVMVISLLTFSKTQHTLGPIGLSPLTHLPKPKKLLQEIAVNGTTAEVPVVHVLSAVTDMLPLVLPN